VHPCLATALALPVQDGRQRENRGAFGRPTPTSLSSRCMTASACSSAGVNHNPGSSNAPLATAYRNPPTTRRSTVPRCQPVRRRHRRVRRADEYVSDRFSHRPARNSSDRPWPRRHRLRRPLGEQAAARSQERAHGQLPVSSESPAPNQLFIWPSPWPPPLQPWEARR